MIRSSAAAELEGEFIELAEAMKDISSSSTTKSSYYICRCFLQSIATTGSIQLKFIINLTFHKLDFVPPSNGEMRHQILCKLIRPRAPIHCKSIFPEVIRCLNKPLACTPEHNNKETIMVE